VFSGAALKFMLRSGGDQGFMAGKVAKLLFVSQRVCCYLEKQKSNICRAECKLTSKSPFNWGKATRGCQKFHLPGSAALIKFGATAASPCGLFMRCWSKLDLTDKQQRLQ
jgi:hypothetical protein